MSDVDLLILAPWIVFAGAVATLTVMTFSRGGRGGRQFRRRRNSRPPRR
ncbi:MAG TPA: hypothetical protein VGG35_14245 [Streptosporangiaceae bacterium]